MLTLEELLNGRDRWEVVGSVPARYAEEFVQALAAMFPQHTVGLLKWPDRVDLRISPALTPLQLLAWDSAYRTIAAKYQAPVCAGEHHGA